MKKVVRVLIEWSEMGKKGMFVRKVRKYFYTMATFKPGDQVGMILKTGEDGKLYFTDQAIRWNMFRRYKKIVLGSGVAEKMLSKMPTKKAVEQL